VSVVRVSRLGGREAVAFGGDRPPLSALMRAPRGRR
jgi:hypothetical protein